MPSSPRTPTLEELIAILSAASVSSAETWDASVELTLKISKARLAELGVNLLAYPSDVLRGLATALEQLGAVRTREYEWATHEPPGATIDDCINFLKFQLEQINPTKSLAERTTRSLYLNTITRLMELLERRKAGGVYTQRDEQRQRDSAKWRFEDSPAAEELRKRQERTRRRTSGRPDYRSPFDDPSTWSERQEWKNAYEQWAGQQSNNTYGGTTATEEEVKRHFQERMNRMFEETLRSGRYGDQFRDPFTDRAKQSPPPPPGGKRRWYEVLGVPPAATKDEISKAYRRLAKRFHPDRAGGSHDKMTEINAARDEGLGGF